MSRQLTSHQPDFMPYMGFFKKVYDSDFLVFSEDVLFSKKGMHNWNYIKTSQGERKKLTVPVYAHQSSKLSDVTIVDPKKNLSILVKTLHQNYSKSPYFAEAECILRVITHIASLYKDQPLDLVTFNVTLTIIILKEFGIRTQIISSGGMNLVGKKDVRIIDMCHKTSATSYLSGEGAKNYHDHTLFEASGIKLDYVENTKLCYPQINGEFIENLSVFDYVCNCGFNIPDQWTEIHAERERKNERADIRHLYS